MSGKFEAKVAIVTRGGSGIGAAIAERLASEGARVMLAGRTLDRLEAQAASIRAAGGVAGCQATDVSDRVQVERLIDATIEAFGGLDILVNNAGTGALGRITEAPPEQWDEVMGTDAASVFYACRAAIPHLAKRRGSIVNVASISGMGADHGMSIYNAAKAAVINFTRGRAADHAIDGIRVNAVSPGATDTPMIGGTLKKHGHHWEDRIPLGRIGLASEMASAVVFLASDDASDITGHNLVVDGGLTALTGQPSLLTLLRG